MTELPGLVQAGASCGQRPTGRAAFAVERYEPAAAGIGHGGVRAMELG